MVNIEFHGIESLDAGPIFNALHPMFNYAVPEVSPSIRSLMNSYETFVVVGMGGSVLPLKVFVKAFRLEDKILLLDSLDRIRVESLLNRPKTLFCVASKSGETLEIKALLNELLVAGKAKDLLIATDPQSGFLRKLVQEESWPSLEIPTELGGRFTNFTVLHRALLERFGISFSSILEKSYQTKAELKSDSKVLHLLHQSLFGSGKSKLVLWAYGEKFLGFAEWLQQVLAESLGKRDAKGSSVGIFPIILKGPQDQHSVLQLLMEGPQDFAIWFLDETSKPSSGSAKTMPKFSELRGVSLEGLSEIFCQAIFETFRERQSDPRTKIPLVRIRSSLDCAEVGKLIAVFHALIEYSGQCLGINAFDQPGVERGKQLARELLKEVQ